MYTVAPKIFKFQKLYQPDLCVMGIESTLEIMKYYFGNSFIDFIYRFLL